MPNLDILGTLDVLDKVDPDGLLDLSGSVAEKVQNQARLPPKEQLTRMKRAFRPGREMSQLIDPVRIAAWSGS